MIRELKLDNFIYFHGRLQTGILERRIFRLHSSSKIVTSKTRCPCCAFPPELELDLNLTFLQSPQAQLMNNFVSGAIGGFAGTALNTP